MSSGSDSGIKKRFVLEQGIDQSPNTANQPNCVNLPQASCLGEVRPFYEQLKIFDNVSKSQASNYENKNYVQLESKCNSYSKKRIRKRSVNLHSDVSVIPIPMRHEYSERVKERIWTSASELYQNALRNTVEYASEGWNWRNAVEDDNMITAPSGELIHPVHLRNLLQIDVPTQVDLTKQNILR